MNDALTTDRLSVSTLMRLGVAGESACLELARSLAASGRRYAGRGIEARIGGRRLRLGTEAFCHELCGAPPAGPAHPNFDSCYVFLADDGGWLAAFELTDRRRPSGGAALARAVWMRTCVG